MEWIKSILPLLLVFIGWALSEKGRLSADKRQDKRKLRKLLSYLLELRYYFSRELSIGQEIDEYLNKFKENLVKKLRISNNDIDLNFGNEMEPLIKRALLKIKSENSKYEYLGDNIDNILNDISEVLPIFAFELRGRYNIKERLNGLDIYLNEFKDISSSMPFDIKDWIQPRIVEDLLKDVDENIELIAGKIDRITQKKVLEKIKSMSFNSSDEDMEKLVNEWILRMEESFNRSQNN